MPVRWVMIKNISTILIDSLIMRIRDDDITQRRWWHEDIQDINILRTNSLSQETIRYPCFKPEIVSQAHEDPYTWNIQIFKKFEKFKFYPKITKTSDINDVDHHPINSRNYAAAYYQTLEEVRGLCCWKKKSKTWKIANIWKKLLKFVILKSLRTFHYISKLRSNILSNPRGSSVAIEARET